jgi:hypothetical protein
MRRDRFCSRLRLRGQGLAPSAGETVTSAIDGRSKAQQRWLVVMAMFMLWCVDIGNAQSSLPAQSGQDEISSQNVPTFNNPSQTARDDASKAAQKPGSVIGTVLDQSGSVAIGAIVRLTSEDKSFSREVVSGDNGQFAFSNVPPGTFQLSVNAAGFGDRAFFGELTPGQTYLVPSIVLSIPTVVTAVNVAEDPVQVATEQVKEEEHQRVFGFIPNFYVSYHPDAPPLTTKLKFELAWKSTTDPITIVGTGFLAGLQQAGGQYSEFGGGAEGYGKRLGAAYADVVASTFLSGAVFPTLLKQDPRYFYKGTGSSRSRLWRAVNNSIICKGDNGNWQPNYSNIAGSFGGAAISSTYYPTRHQGMVVLTNGLIRMGESSIAGVVQEFVVRRFTKEKRQVAVTSNSSQAPAAQGQALSSKNR